LKEQYPHYPALFDRIDRLMREKDHVLVAIDGMSAAGKTTLADLLKQIYQCNVFHMDSFFLRPGQRTEARLAEVGGNVDYERFQEEVLRGLGSKGSFSYRAYNCKTASLSEPIWVEPNRLNVVEGAYSLHPNLIGSYDLKVFLGIEAPAQRARILDRDGPEKLRRFLEEWSPRENAYHSQMKIREKSDIIL
jgi:uridine kinase